MTRLPREVHIVEGLDELLEGERIELIIAGRVTFVAAISRHERLFKVDQGETQPRRGRLMWRVNVPRERSNGVGEM